jgi:sulfite exporter TauE/SafE
MSLIAIFLASLVGSPHCAAMCGGFVSFYSAKTDRPLLSHFAYHGGRLVAYALLGALAGIAGKSIDNWGLVIGLQKISAVAVGILLIFWGLRGVFGKGQTFSLTSTNNPIFKKLLSFYHQALSAKPNANWTKRALILGLLSALLPCGWLYAYVAVSATTTSALYGAITMIVFWSGTLPALIALGSIIRVLAGKLQIALPRLIGILFIVAGIFSLVSHFYMLIPMNHEHMHHH